MRTIPEKTGEFFNVLESLPTLHQGQDSNLKISTPNIRIGLVRTGEDDTRQGYIEILTKNAWQVVARFSQIMVDDEWIDTPTK